MRSFYIIIILVVCSKLYGQSTMIQNRGSQFNPATGLNATMLMRKSENDTEHDGFMLQGVELQFNSDVDAYFRAQVVIGVHPEIHEHHDEEEEEEHEEEEGHNQYEIHPEEAYVETIAIPSVTLKAGKFLSQFGKYNAIHLHALPFVYRGVVQKEVFGGEGFTAPGVSASFLLPIGWYSELSLEAMQSDNETLFVKSSNATVYVAKMKNLWDLNDETTIEWGLSGLNYERASFGDNEKETSKLLGTDLTIKWRPTQNGRSSSAMWSTEFIQKQRSGTVNSENGGITSFIRYQIKQRWFTQAQYEFYGINKSDDEESIQAYTGLIGYIPSEFSAIRLQFDKISSHEDDSRISLQFNMSIGAHPAHNY